jgi:hypothetical protein
MVGGKGQNRFRTLAEQVEHRPLELCSEVAVERAVLVGLDASGVDERNLVQHTDQLEQPPRLCGE